MSPETQGEPAQAVSAPASRSDEALVMHPATGEVLDLATASTQTLADWRWELVDAKHQLDALASDLDAEIGRRLDYEGGRSARIGDYEVEIQAPTFVEWDVPRLSIALEALVSDGRISRGAAERCIKTKVERSGVNRELEQLRRHADPEVRDSVERCRADVARTRRRVTVKRAH